MTRHPVPTPRFLAVLALLALLGWLSGERESELRARLAYEAAFAESMATEARWALAEFEKSTLNQGKPDAQPQ